MDKAVIFDMDGLMIDSSQTWEDAETKLLNEFEKNYDFEIRKKYLGKRLSGVVEAMIYNYRLPITQDVGVKKLKSYLEESFQRSDVSLLPGSRKLIKNLFGNYKLAVASSSPKEIIEIVIKRFDFENYFPVIVSGEEVINGKPFPDIFLRTAAILQISSNRCIVLEDAPHGISAAKAAGMKAIAVNNLKNYSSVDFKNADLFVQSLEEIDGERIRRIFNFDA